MSTKWTGWVLLGAALNVLACTVSSEDAGDDVAAVTPAEDDFTSASKLVGRYRNGRGVFAALDLEQVEVDGKRKNQFRANRVEQCASSSCPSVDVRGSWYARSGRITFYFEDGDQLSATVSLRDGVLQLKNARGTVIAKLDKALVAEPNIGEVLARYGVPEMTVEISPKDIAAHETTKISFDQAFDKAVDLFVNDEEGGLHETTSEHDLDELGEFCASGSAATRAEGVLCLANRSTTSVHLLPPDDEETPPYGESPSDYWIFNFYVADFTDHGYFAVIAKDGSEESYIYAFN